MAVLAMVFAIWLPAGASADTGKERQFTDLVHRERASAGVPGYAEMADLADVARGQAERMAREQRLYHNPRLGDEVENWEALGENVGRGPSVETIHQAFMDSPTHRSEILSTDFTEVGVGVAVAPDGEIWVAQVFRRPAAEPAPTPPAAAPQTAPTTTARPAPAATTSTTSTTTTAPSTTTTTTTVVAPSPPPPPPVAPEVLAATEPSPPTRAPEARSVSLSRAATAADRDPDVTTAVRIAATMLVLVVAAQTRYVVRQAGGVSLRPASSPRTRLAATAATLP